MRRTVGIAVVLGVLGWGQVARADTIVYTDLASFQAASTTTNIDFSGIAADGSFVGPVSNLTVGSVNFNSPTGNLFVIDDTQLGCCHFPSSLAPATLFDDDVRELHSASHSAR